MKNFRLFFKAGSRLFLLFLSLGLGVLHSESIDPRIDPAIYKNEFGFYYVPLDHDHNKAVTEIKGGIVHEKETLECLAKLYVDGDIVHAGAFFGDMLPFFSKLAAANTVWAFEPVELHYACAKETKKLNKISNVNLFNAALSNEKKQLLIRKKENGIRLAGRSHVVNTLEYTDDFEKIQALTIDEVVANNKNPIGLIHLDIEQHEIEALKGAKKTIERFQPIIVLEVLKPMKNKIHAYMNSIGYKATRSVDKNVVFLPKNSI